MALGDQCARPLFGADGQIRRQTFESRAPRCPQAAPRPRAGCRGASELPGEKGHELLFLTRRKALHGIFDFGRACSWAEDARTGSHRQPSSHPRLRRIEGAPSRVAGFTRRRTGSRQSRTSPRSSASPRKTALPSPQLGNEGETAPHPRPGHLHLKMQCPACNREIQEQWVACPFCAARLEKCFAPAAGS